MNETEIKPGQIWSDGSIIQGERFLMVIGVGETTVECVPLRTGKISIIQRSRMKPGSRGYSLALDPATVAEISKHLNDAAFTLRRPTPK